MNIQFFSYTDNGDISYTQAKDMILGQLLKDGSSGFADYSDMSGLFDALDIALHTANVLVIAAAPPVYNGLKSTVIEAFGLQAEKNAAIELALGDTLLSEEIIDAHCTVPSSCVTLLSVDGMYCGFYVESEGQYIVLLPLDKDRLGYILQNSVFPFAQDGASQPHGNSPENSAQQGVPKEYTDEAFAVIRLLRENYLRVAIPSTSASEYLKSILVNCDDYEEQFRFTPHIEDTGDQRSGEYAAQIAKISRELAGADIGVSITEMRAKDTEDGETELYSFICVADEHKAIVRKLYANPGESESDLLGEAAFGLLMLIKTTASDIAAFREALYADGYGADAPEAGADEPQEDGYDEDDEEYNGRPVAAVGKKGMIAALVIIGLALLASLIVGLKFTGVFDGLFTKKETETKTGVQTSVSVPAYITSGNTSAATDIGTSESSTPSETAASTDTSASVPSTGNTSATKPTPKKPNTTESTAKTDTTESTKKTDTTESTKKTDTTESTKNNDTTTPTQPEEAPQ